MPNLFTIMRDHVTLATACIDRIYLNGYLPNLQTSGQLAHFIGKHHGKPIPSPALFPPLRRRFLGELKHFAEHHDVPIVDFKKLQKPKKGQKRKVRKDEIAARYRADFHRPEGVVFIGFAQEKMSSWKAHKAQGPGVHFNFYRASAYVNHHYVYVQDRQWGPGFVKIGSYVPYPVKVCLNGHEWVKQQLRHEGIAFEALDNGFRWCEDPDRLQATCDRLGAQDVLHFFERWSKRLPWPLTAEDWAAGFKHRLSIWQLEVSLTHIFDKPVQGRHFFEEVIRENLDLGRPDRVSLVFPGRHTRRTVAPRYGYRTRVITRGVDPCLHISYKHSDLKQYFKEGRGLRTELTINETKDFGVNKGLANLDHLAGLGHQVNRQLLEIERVSHNCRLSYPSLDRVQSSTVEKGQRASAMRFGDPRVMALMEALTRFLHLPHGFRHRELRPQVAALLGLSLDEYTPGRMTYDLRRLRLKGIISRIKKTHRYVVTTYGLKVALFFSKVYLRILRPGWMAINETTESLTTRLRRAFARVEAELQHLCRDARLEPQPPS